MNKDNDLSNIPRVILKKVLSNLSDNSLTASVTRRSAGLPIIVQTVVQAARKAGDTAILLSTVDKLYNTADLPLLNNHNQQHDLCQSHALNILKVIFCDASLSFTLMPHLSKMTILILKCFDSPSWAIRNAATQLISILVSRIFGQRSNSSQSSSTTLEEFESLFPLLLECMCKGLRDCEGTSDVAVKPSLYVILTLLAGLSMSKASLHTCRHRSFLTSSVVQFLSSPVHSLRKLSAQAYVALSPFDEAEKTLRESLHYIGGQRMSMNNLHGWSVVAHTLIYRAAESTNMGAQVVQFVLDHEWLLYMCPGCLTVTALMLNTLKMALVHTDLTVQDDDLVIHRLWGIMNRFLIKMKMLPLVIQLDQEQCVRISLEVLTTIRHIKHTTLTVFQADRKENHIEQVISGLKAVLADLRECVLDSLLEDGQELAASPEVQHGIWNSLLTENQATCLQKSVRILLKETICGRLAIPPSIVVKLNGNALKSQFHSIQGVQGPVFALQGITWAVLEEKDLYNRLDSIHDWCKQLSANTSPTANENIRLLAAQCLTLSGKNILHCCCQNRSSPFAEDVVVVIINCCVLLLEDSEAEVRQEAANFITELAGVTSCQSNMAYSMLSNLVMKNFRWCKSLMADLLSTLYYPACLRQAIEMATKSSCDALFEPEVDSVMAEGPMRQLWVYRTMRNICSSNAPGFLTEQIHSLALHAGAELETQMPAILKSTQEASVFNLTSHDKVIASLLGLQCLAHLEHCVLEQSPSGDQYDSYLWMPLHRQLTSLKQNASIHPFLHKESFLYL